MADLKQRVNRLGNNLGDKMRVTTAKTSRSESKDVDIAVVKATSSQHHVVPKEKHVRTLKAAAGGGQHGGAGYVIQELRKRLDISNDWLTALKTLITVHRLMRETDASFLQELLRLGGKGGTPASSPDADSSVLRVGNFLDRTNSAGRFDFSEWVRAYGKYLDEQLAVYGAMGWYVEQEGPGAESRMRALPTRDLLLQLPHLQRLLRRLMDCLPRGAAEHDPVVLFSLLVVVKESFRVYKAVSEGVINLADAFFQMDYLEAARALELYREGAAAGDALAAYYAAVGQIQEVRSSVQLPVLSPAPREFVTSMEAYLAEAPRALDATTGQALAKKTAPLRKGRLVQSSKWEAVQEPGVRAAADPGMLLPLPGAQAASFPPAAASPAPVVPAPSPAPPPPQPRPPPLDLLGFDDALPAADAPSSPGTAAPAAGSPAAQAASQAGPLSPLEQLGSLDFTLPSAGSGSSVPLHSAPSASGSGGNPFGVPLAANGGHAAPQPAAPPAYQPQQQTFGSQGSFAAAAPPSGMQLYGVQQPPLSAGLALPAPPTLGSSGSFATHGGYMQPPLASPSGNGNGGYPAAGSLALLSPPSSNELSKAAGTHDPFSGLVSGLPSRGTPGKASPSQALRSPVGGYGSSGFR